MRLLLILFLLISTPAFAVTSWDGGLPGLPQPCATDEIPKANADGTWRCAADAGAAGGDSITVDGGAVVDPDFDDGGDINFTNTTNTITATMKANTVSADELNATGVEAELEAVLDLQDMQGAVTDAQVPDNITITDNATVTGTQTLTNKTLTTPTISGKVDADGGTVSDDDCTGEQGLFWFDDTDNAFEFCDANSGTPSVLGGGGGGGTFPGSSTDNAAVRFDGTGGSTVQNSGVIIDDSDNVSGIGSLDVGDTISGSWDLPNGESLLVLTDDTSFDGYALKTTEGADGLAIVFGLTRDDGVSFSQNIRMDSSGRISFENGTTSYFFLDGASAKIQEDEAFAWSSSSTQAYNALEAGFFYDGSLWINLGSAAGTSDKNLSVDGFRFEDTSAGAPTAGDCDADAERGRLVIDTTNNRLYICNGATRGWDFIALSD